MGKPYVCHVCNEAFSERKDLREHLKKRWLVHSARGDSGRKLKASCPACGETFSCERYGLEPHLASCHPGERLFPCQDCGKMFLHPRSLKEHRAKYHVETSQKALRACHVCGEQVVSRDYQKHVNKHTTHVCQQCGKGYKYAVTLRWHMASAHSDEKPFMCDQCGRGFKLIQLLRSHKLHQHPGPQQVRRKWKCHICHNSFNTKAWLQKHVRKGICLRN